MPFGLQVGLMQIRTARKKSEQQKDISFPLHNNMVNDRIEQNEVLF
jgi:hypothetical protein